jgi:hypothetical protein
VEEGAISKRDSLKRKNWKWSGERILERTEQYHSGREEV